MGWRSVIISRPAYLSLSLNALSIKQDDQQTRVPLEDISVLLIDHPQITLTAQLLSACANERIAVLCVDQTHQPNGVLIPFIPHHRALKVMRMQLAIKKPVKKRLHQQLIQQKITNQAALLQKLNQFSEARKLQQMARELGSGDPKNHEAQAAQAYFKAIYGSGFTRHQSRFYNSAMNYCYAIIRSALARSLVCHGLLPAFGLFHNNEQNAFNLADDLIEPFRPCVDAWVLHHYSDEPDKELEATDKHTLVGFLHADIGTADQGTYNVLALSQAMIISLIQSLQSKQESLLMPVLVLSWPAGMGATNE